MGFLRSVGLMSVACLPLLAGPGRAAADFFDLLPLAPESANLLILVDAERFRSSAIAQKEGWDGTGPDASPLVPPRAKAALLASRVDVAADYRNLSDMALIEVSGPVNMKAIARRAGGYVDEVEGFPAAFSGRDAYAVEPKPGVVAVMFPANRQDLARYLRGVKARKTSEFGPNLKRAIVEAHGEPQVVMGLDVENLLASPQLESALERVEALKDKEVDKAALARVLAGMKGLTLTVTATEVLEGKLTVEFAGSTAPLKDVARELFLAAVEGQGLMLDDLKQWRVAVGGTTVVFQGRLSPEGLQTIFHLVPVPAAAIPTGEPIAAAAEGDDAAKAPAGPTAEASKRYYKAVETTVAEFRAKVKADPGRRARVWADKYAAEVDRLPILGVDPELVDYGADVAKKLRALRDIALNTSLERDYRQATAAGNQGVGYGYGYGYGGFYGGTNLGMTSAVLQKQSVAVVKAQENQVWGVLQQEAADVRRKMTMKYNVEF